ncbi:hypothetical protein R2601_03198 [Salipiger bermudensis HTCC2601]|uniref:Uncharacterized protein n=1 Tax=Salipiger bermudensis (strain DSM 26914 / JCM 13377 / KCTC 12554 / HTCC2601) TaxID=314265 RepID=Q0FWK6_SALBH|nr:hypothetical protein R2601_03198 [Salipiger bermudensis HTCC2601]
MEGSRASIATARRAITRARRSSPMTPRASGR